MPGSIVIGDDITIKPRRAPESSGKYVAARRAARTGSHCRHHQKHTVAMPTSHTATATAGTIDGCGTPRGIAGSMTGDANTWSITNAAAGCAIAGPVRHSNCAPSMTSHENGTRNFSRSEEHTSELQSQSNLVCRLLLE